MKTTIFIAAAAASLALLSGCAKNEGTVVAERSADATVLVDINYTETKATGTVPSGATYQTSDESKVQSLQVIFFNGDDVDGYAKVDNASSVSVSCSAGSRTAYALVNGPDVSAITSMKAFKAIKSSLVEDADNFTMIGSKDVTLTAGSNSDVTIDVNRIASKLVIRGITNSLSSGSKLKVKRVYITNVAAQANLSLDTLAIATYTWYNKGGYKAASNLGSFTQDLSVDTEVDNGSKLTKDFYYYAYPNKNAQANYAEAWAPKRTMLVIQAEINGVTYDYPLTFPELEPNKMYVLDNLTITMPGNKDDGKEGGSDEENPIQKSSANYSVNVVDWTVVKVDDVTI